MTELQLARGATRWLRILLVAALLGAGLALVTAIVDAARATTDPGVDSEVDYYLEVNPGSVDRSQYAVHPDLNFTNGQSAGTWEAWIYPTNDSLNRQAIFSKEGHSVMGLDSGRLWTAFWSGDAYLDKVFNVKPPLNAWSHVAYVKSGTTVKIYLNGYKVVDSVLSAYQYLDGDSVQFTIGRRTNGEFFTGGIDEVRVWNRELGSNELLQGMHARVSPASSGLSGYWDFNEPGDSVAYDRTNGSYVRDLSIVGSPSRIDVKRVTSKDGDTVITFPRTYLPGKGGWTAPENIANERVLVVGGGGAGGSGTNVGYEGGGGGAGGFLEASISFDSPTYSVVVGQGGVNSNGQNSSAFSLTAFGGGRGGAETQPGSSGGSGGGGAHPSTDPGSGTTGQGFAGGKPDANGKGGGGGGAAEAGNTDGQGFGGDGKVSTISGTAVYYAGGGGAYAGGGREGGQGGGATANTTLNEASANGTPNTGGGGAAAYSSTGVMGGYGGSGVVIVRYTPVEDLAFQPGANNQLQASTVIPTATNASFTMEAWVYPTDLTDWKSVINQQQSLYSCENRTFLGIYYGQLRFWVNSGSNIDTGFTVRANRWTHLALSAEGDDVRVYADGSLVYENLSYNRPTAIGTVFNIASTCVSSEYLVGSIDQVKVWNSRLTDAEVALSMHTYSTSGIAKSLIAHFDFNEFDPTQTTDRSGNGKHAAYVVGSSGIYDSSNFSADRILQVGTAFGEQNYAKFKRTYLTATGGWTPPGGVTRFRTLVVGGGGGGGSKDYGGGGGAGGLYTLESTTLSSQTVARVQVGQGGPGGKNEENATAKGASGQSSVLGTLEAPGGGGGGGKAWSSTETWATGLSGGSGGGHGEDNIALAAASSTFNAPSAGKYGNPGGALTFTNGSRMGTGGGGAGGPGTSVTRQYEQGNGGAGRASTITGASVFYAAGGGGGSYQTTSGIGGSSIGGNGQNSSTGPKDGATNTGSGGGGGSSSTGGSGGSGVVILSWGPYLEVTASPIVARAGAQFATPIKVQLTDEVSGAIFSSTSPVSVTASAGVLTLNGATLTQSYTVNAVNGIATFTGLGFASSVAGAQTLTFTSDSYVGTTLTVTPSYYPGAVEIKTSGTTGGSFVNGEFFASTNSGTTVILASDLTNHMQSYSTVISASGAIKVVNGFTSTSSNNLTLKTPTYIEVSASQQVRTSGGDIVLWADSDNSGGGFIRLLSAATLCTTASTCSTTDTGGGDIVLGGGLPDANNPNRPGGTAKGSSSTYNATGTAESHGVQLGTLGVSGAGAKLYSAGGSITVRGQMISGATAVNSRMAALEAVGGTTIYSGNGKIYLFGQATDQGGSGIDGLLGLNTFEGTTTITSKSTDSDSIVFEAKENTTSPTSLGIWGGNDGTYVNTPGGLVIRANHINNSLELNLNVSRSFVLESYDASLRDDSSNTVFKFTVGSGDNFRFSTPPSSVTIGSASNSNEIELDSSFTVSGPIEVYADDIDVYNNITIQSTSESAQILLKARDWIDIRNGTDTSTHNIIRTNNGDIILWSDSDGSGDGSIYLGDSNELNSANGAQSKTQQGGGRITLAGGNAGVDDAGHPLGYAADTGTQANLGSQTYALVLQEDSEVYSGGGKITYRARSNANQETAHINIRHKTWSGTGQIVSEFIHTGNYAATNLRAEWASNSSLSPAIEISSTRTGTGGAALYNSDGVAFSLQSINASGGGISISASVTATTTDGIDWNEGDLLSAAGSITVNTNGQLNWSDAGARSIGAKASSDVLASNANVQFTAQSYEDSTDNASSKMSTSGSVQINPYASNFNADSEIEFSVEAGSFTFGSLANVDSATKGIKISKDVSTGGQITLTGNSVTLGAGADLVTANFGTPITLKAKSWIDVVSNQSSTLAQTNDSDFSTIQTNHGDITLWSDSDADQEGLIWIGHNARLNSDNGVYSYDAVSGGGDIYLAGGLADGSGKPSSYAWDKGSYGEAASTDFAVGVGAHVDLFTGGGDLVIRASKKNSAGIAAFIFRSKSEFITGTGRLVIDSKNTGGVEAFEYYAETEQGALFSSHSTAEPAISISASISGTSTQALRLYNQNSANPTTIQSLANSGGGIAISSMLGSTTTATGTYLGALNLLSANGAISFSSNSVLNYSNEAWPQYWGSRAGTSVSNSVADVSMRVNGLDGSNNSVTLSTSGAVSVQPFASNFGWHVELWHNITGATNYQVGSDNLINTAIHVVYVRGTVTASGPVEIYGQTLDWSSNYDLKSLGLGSRILLKSKADIMISDGSGTADSSHTDFQTNQGDLILWSDGDGSGSGGITVGNYTQFNTDNGVKSREAVSGGGDIVFGGGATADSAGFPAGYAQSGTTYSTDRGLQLQWYGGYFTGGGDLVWRGRASGFGITVHSFTEIFTGNGRVDIDAVSTGTGSTYGFAFIDNSWSGNDGPLTVVSHATASPAIKIYGSSAGTSQGTRLWGGGGGNIITLASTAANGGGIDIYGTSPANSSYDVAVLRNYLLSRNGAITISANVNYLQLDSGGYNYYGSVSGNQYVSTSSANVTFLMNEFDFDEAVHYFRTSGDVSLLPKTGNTFGMNGSFLFSTNGIRNLTIGKDPLPGDTIRSITVSGDHTVSGEISILGGSVYPTGNFAVTGQGDILMKGLANVQTGSTAKKITTQGGDITFWADSDATSGGNIYIPGSSIFSSNGGDITLAGGLDDGASAALGIRQANDGKPDGYAVGRVGELYDSGVLFAEPYQARSPQLLSGGGNIYIAGISSNHASSTRTGVFISSGVIDSGAGKVRIRGNIDASSNTSYQRAILFGTQGSAISILSSNSASDAIYLQGDASAASNGYCVGIQSYDYQDVLIANEGSGGIQLIGDGCASNSTDTATYTDGIALSDTAVLARSGTIRLEGTTRNTTTAASGIFLNRRDGSGTNGVYIGALDRTYTLSTGKSLRIATSSANIEFRSNSLNANQTPISTSGAVSFRSRVGVSFSSSPVLTNVSIADSASGLEIGHPGTGSGQNTSNISVGRAYSISGPISVYGQHISVSADLTVTSGSSRITLKGTGAIETGTGVDLRTAGGSIVFWSDADSSGAGNIKLGGTNTLCTGWNAAASTCTLTGGGDIVLGGGAADSGDSSLPAGSAAGSGNVVGDATGVALGPCLTNSATSVSNVISTRGGDLLVKGVSTNGNTGTSGIQAGVAICNGTTINMETGKIDISAQFLAATTVKFSSALWFAPWIFTTNKNAVVINSSNTASDALRISASGSKGDFTSYGLGFNNNAGGGALFEIGNFWDDVSRIAHFDFNSGGPLKINPSSTSFTAPLTIDANFAVSSTASLFEVGSASNSSPIYITGAKTIAGDISLVANSVSISAAITTTGTGKKISIHADQITISANVSAVNSSRIEIAPQTVGRNIVLGSTSTSALAIPSGANTFLYATTLQLGDSRSGNISVEGSSSFSSAKITNLKLVTPGDVTAVSGAVLSAPNLAIDAGGNVNLPGSNSVVGNVAISASGSVTYSSAVSYSPAVVDGVTPVFGIGVAISQTNSPAIQNRNAFLAVTFNPPPQFVVTDSYSNTLDGNNRLASSYTVSATVHQGTGTVVGLTASRSGDVYSFNSLRIDSNPGTYSFAISVDDGASGFTTNSIEYTVLAGDPASLDVTSIDSTAPAGQASFSFTVEVQDSAGNPITAGTNANVTVSASISGTTAVLVSGNQAQADNTGVATFNDLLITGSVSDTISISFWVEFTNNQSVYTTVSSQVYAITLSPGTPTQLAIDSSDQTKANRSTLSAVVISLLDDYGNVVEDRSDQITVSIGSGSGANLVGTNQLSFAAGAGSAASLTFDDIALQGTVGEYRLDFESDQSGISSVSHDVTLVHGAPASISVSRLATAARSGIPFGTQPVIKLLDLDDNLVPSEASVSAEVSGATLSGTDLVAMVDGIATFSNLVLTGLAGDYTIDYEITQPVGLASFSTFQTLQLTAGNAAKLSVVQQPQDVVAGVAQAVSVSVQVVDAQDNPTTVTQTTTIEVELLDYGQGLAVVQTSSDLVLSPGASTATISNLTFTKAVQTAQLRFTTSGLAVGESSLFRISPAAAEKLVWVQDLVSATNDVVISPNPSVQILDEFDNAVVQSSDQTTISVSVIVGGNHVLDLSGGQKQSTNASSLVTFDALKLRAKVGSYQLRFTAIDPGDPIDGFTLDSNNFDVEFGSAVSLTTSPSLMNVVNRLALNDITVSVLDSAGNLVENNTASVTPAVSGLSLSGSPVSAVGGRATFSGLVVSGTVGNYDLGFTANGLTAATTSISLTHGAAASVQLTVSATARNAEPLATQPVVRILDADGNLVSSGDESMQTVELVVSPGTVVGVTAISASAGIATFSGISLVDEEGSKTLTGRIFSPQTLASNQVVDLSFGAATKLTLETSASGADSGIALVTQPILALRDSSDNIVTGVAHNVLASIDPAASLSGATVAVNTNTGLATFTALSISGTVASYSISFAIDGSSSSDVASVSQNITLGHGVATGLRVVSSPTSGVAGVTLSPIVIEVIDHRGNRVTSGPTSSKTISITNARFGPVLGTLAVSMSSGVATFDDVAITQADSQRLSFNVAGFTAGSTANFPLAAAAPSKLGFSGYPLVDQIAGQRQPNDAFVRVLDEFGNYATATTTVSVAVQIVLSSDTSSVSRTLGYFSIPQNEAGVLITKSNLYVQKVGNFQVKASASNLEVGLSNTFAISNATAHTIAFVQAPPASVSSGITISPVVELELRDAYGNPVLNSTASVTVTSVSGAVTSIVGGVAQNTLGSARILFPSLAISGTQGSAQLRFTGTLPQGSLVTSYQNANIQINAGSAYQLSVSTTSVAVVNRGSFPELTVRILDRNGNLVSSSAQVNATLSGATLSGVVNVNAEAGIATFSALALSGQAGSYTLSFESQDLVSTTTTISLGHGIAYSIDLAAPASAKVSQTTSEVVVKIFDEDNNLVATGDQSSQTVELSITDADLVGSIRVSASAGIATFSNVAITGSISNKVMTATITDPVEITDSETISLDFGDPYSLDLTQAASGFVNRELFDVAPEVTVRDMSGNVVSASGMVIRATVAGLTLSGTVTAAADTGVAVFANDLKLSGVVGDYQIVYTAEGTSASGVIVASQDISLLHGSASQLVITQAAADALAGQDFDTQPIVELQDPDGNRVSTSDEATSSVRVRYSGNPWNSGTKTGVTLEGTNSISLSAGVGSFAGLRLIGEVGAISLTYEWLTDNDVSVSQSITLEPGDATNLNVVTEPQDVVAGVAFASDPQVEFLDAYSNRVTRLTASATLQARLLNSTTLETKETSAAFGATNGLVTFTGLSFTKAGFSHIQFEPDPDSSLPDIGGRTTYPFTVSPAAGDSIEFLVTPQSTTTNDTTLAGVGASYPKLRVLDSFGNTVSNAVTTISVSVDPTPISISGDQVTTTDGTALFNALVIKATSGSYDLEFAAEDSNGIFATLSHTVTINPGIPNQLAITQQSATARAGQDLALQPIVEIRDSAGNVIGNSALTVSLTVTGATLVGSNEKQATSGVAGFTGISLTGSASAAVTMSYEIEYGGNTISVSQAIELLAGDAHSASLSWTVTDVQTRVAPQNNPVVTLFDEFGNQVLSDNSTTMNVSLYRPGSLVTVSPVSYAAVAGEYDLGSLTFKATPNTGYYYQFEVAGISAISSSPFTILPGPVAKVHIHQQPSTVVGSSLTMTGETFAQVAIAHLLDQDDNLVTTVDSGNVSAAISSGFGGSLISASASISNGVATFTNLRLIGVVETPEQSAVDYKLRFSYGGFDSTESATLRVKHNLATQLTLVQSAAGGRAGAIFTTQPKVRLLDRYNNWVSTGTAVEVEADIVDENGGTTPTIVGGTAQTTNGEATLLVGINGTVNTSYKLRFVAKNTQGVPITTAEQTGITITHGSASKLRVARQLSSDDGSGNLTKIGAPLNVQPVIEVLDSNDNLVLDHSGVIVASFSALVRGERDYLTGYTVSAVAGVATFSNLAAVAEVGTSYTLNFYREGYQGGSAASSAFILTHGDAEYLTIETQPLGGNKTGDPLNRSPIVAVRDFDGNIATTLNGQSVSAAVFSGGGSVDTSGSNTDRAVVANGLAQFSNLTVIAIPGVEQSLKFELVGVQNSASAAVSSTQSATFSVTVADPHQLSVFTQPCTAADCTAGPTAEPLGIDPVVEIQDRFGNRATQFNGEVSVTAQGNGGYLRDADNRIASVTVSAVSGLATFSGLRLEGTPGVDYSLQFSSGVLVPTSSQVIRVIHTTPSQLIITTEPVGDITGELLGVQPVLEVRDRFGNLAVTDNATQVTASILSGPDRLGNVAPEISGSLTVTAANGIVSFTNLELTGLTGANYVLRFDASGFGVNSQAVVLSPAGAMSFEWVTEPVALRTGEVMPTQPVLRMLDFDGNLASSTAATVTVTVSGGGYIEAGTTSNAVNGEIEFAGLTLVATPNAPQTLIFTATTASGSFTITTTTPLTVEHTSASQMSIDTPYATSAQQGRVLGTQPIIRLFDRFNNPAVNDNSTVVSATIGSGSGGAISGSATATAVGGIVTFAGLAVTGSPGVAYTLDFAASGYGVSGNTQLRLFKTAELVVSYSNMVFSSSPTTSPAIAYTDSTENSITFSAVTTQFCTVNASTGEVSVLGAGTCVIRAEVADGTFYKAKSIETSFVIAKAAQDPVVISNNPYVNFGEVLTLTSTGGSSTATTRFFATGQCQILGDKLMVFGDATEGLEATCTIIASRAGDANYLSSSTEWMDIEVRRVAQAPISIGNSPTVSGEVTLFIVGGSGDGTVSYTVDPFTNNAGCSVTAGVLSASGSGTCEVTAEKAMSVNYNTASSQVVLFNVIKENQQVVITSAPPTMPLPGQTYQLSATASSGLTVSYSITKGQEIQASQQASYSAPVCSLSQSVSGQVLFLRSGECEITATQNGNARYAQGSAKMSILIGQLNQFITFAAVPDQTYGAPAFRLNAVASSNLPVSFTVSAGVNACSVANGMVTITAAGVCEIKASQAGNGSYAPAPNVIRSFTVTPDRAGAPALVSAAVGNQWFTVRYTAPSYTGGSSILGYRLEVRNQSNGLYLNSACPITEPFTCTVVGIPNSVSYTARIAAITSAGIGNFSNNSVPLTPSLAAMSVTQLSAQTSVSGLEMSWIAPQAIDGNFLRYEVYAWEIGAPEPTTPTTTLSNVADAQVSIDLDSIAQAGTISPASYTAPELQIVQPLFMPNSRIHVFGAVRTAPVGFFTLASISQPNTESASVGYNLRVVTITDTRSVSQEINTANGIKLGLSTPSAPTQLNLDTSNPDKITITWAAPNSDGGFPLDSYRVKSNGRVICVDLQTRVCEVNPLDAATVYDIEVQAKNALGFGAAAQSSHTTPEPPVQLSSLQSGAAAALIRIPEMNSFTPRLVRPGSVVSITGTKLNTIRSLALDELGVDFLLISETQMRFRVPESIQPGTYDVVHTSEYGKVTVLDAILVAGDPVNEELEPVAPKPKPGDATPTPTPSPQQPAPGDAGGIKPEPTPAPSDSSSTQGQGNASEPGEVEKPQEGQSSGDASEPELDQNPGTPPVSPDDSRPETNQTESEVALPVSPAQESQLSIWLLLVLLLLATGVGLAPKFARRNREQGID